MDMASDLLQPEGDDVARISWYLRDLISRYQETFSVIEKVTLGAGGLPLWPLPVAHADPAPPTPFQCPKPVITAIHGNCIGAGEPKPPATSPARAPTPASSCPSAWASDTTSTHNLAPAPPPSCRGLVLVMSVSLASPRCGPHHRL